MWIFLVAFTLFMGVEGLYEGIDDITNNLATDLAPLITLFGEQATKQFLSESTSFTDSIIFSIAPLGLITAVVSVIRIYGSSSFKSIIGRSQEAHGVAEAELCSSTSQDVCELWSNGGICRVFGRPKILDFIYNTNIKDEFYATYKKDQRKEIVEEAPSCGIYRPRTLFVSNDEKMKNFGWKETKSSRWTWLKLIELLPMSTGSKPDDHWIRDENRIADEPSANPNLTLNIGIRTLGKFQKMIHWSVLIFSVLLQLSFFGYAAWVTFYNPSFVSEGNSTPQAKVWFGLTILGTIMLVFGMILCARLIDLKSRERRYKAFEGTPEIFWLQPGGQRLGDQLFHAFAFSERRNEYTISERVDDIKRERTLLLAVASTTLGWVLQFVGLRGSPGSVALFQFVATLIMSFLRAALRGKRLGAHQNLLESQVYKRRNLIEGHELDWQAMNIDEHDRGFVTEWRVSDHFPPGDRMATKEEIPEGVAVKSTTYLSAYYAGDDALITQAANCTSKWIASQEARDASPDQEQGSDSHSVSPLNAGAKIMRLRSRLAELTGVQFGLPPEQAWGGEIRTTALQLQKALQVSAEYIFAQFPLVDEWKSDSAPKAIAWKSSCWLLDQTSQNKDQAGIEQQKEEGHLTLGFQMYNRDGKWNISSHQLEAVLGLWSWSLKQSELGLSPTAEEELTRSKMVVVERSKRDEVEAALYLWVTQTRQVREYDAGGRTSRSDNLSIPTACLLSSAQVSKQSSGAPRQTDTENTDGFTILGIPTDGSTSLLQLMAQDVYTVFINRIVDVVGDLRGTGHPEDYLTMRDHSLSTASRTTPLIELTNPHIDALANALVSAGVATREDALMSIVPAFLSQMKLPLLDEDMVQNLLDWAKFLRRDLKFREGAALMTWMLPRCPPRFRKQGLRCLGDLYRRASLSKRRGDQDFGLSGMRNMKERHSALTLDRQAQDILSCYEHLCQFFQDPKPPRARYLGSEAMERIHGEVYRRKESEEQDTKATIGQEDFKWALTFSERFNFPSDGDLSSLCGTITWAIGKNFPELIEDLWIIGRPPREDFFCAPLRTALDQECEVETLHSLLDWPGIDLDVKERNGVFGVALKTPLICAIEANRADVVCSILRRGAYLLQRDKFGMTPLHHAFRESNLGMIQLLLEKGAVIDKSDGGEQTALHFAAESNSEAVIQWLFKKGANIHERDNAGRTPLHFAAKANSEAVIQLLLKNGARIHEKDNNGQTPLRSAMEAENKVAVRPLIENGADVHEKGEKGQTPLHLAARAGQFLGPEIVQLLLENGARIHERDGDGRMPLHLASETNYWISVENVEVLLEKGADMYEENWEGQTALHLAAQHGNSKVLRLLLEKSAENGSADSQRWSSLWSIVPKDSTSIAQVLEEKGIGKPLDVEVQEGEQQEGEDEVKHMSGQ